MYIPIHRLIVEAISRKERGEIVFPGDFLEFGSMDAVKKTFSRLAKDGTLVRLAQGVYLYPKRDPQLGILYPSLEEIAQAIGKRDKVRIQPTGSYALHQLGLSTQVPMKVVYLTDGQSKQIRVGKRTITFKATTPKNIATKGKFSTLAIQALLELGKDGIDEKVMNRIEEVLKREDVNTLRNDIAHAPSWIANKLYAIIKKIEKNG